jgi:hypothetical protein
MLKTTKPLPYSSIPCNSLDDLGSVFKDLGVTLSDGHARFYPFTYGFKASRRLTGEEISTALKSLKDKGYGEFELANREI